MSVELELEIHPDTVICTECGHDCNGISDCGDICICIEEVDEDDYDVWASEQQAAYDDYWGDPLDDFPSYGE